MNIQDLLEQYKLNEQTELFTPQTLRDTINKITLDDVELEEDEQIKTHVLKTMYNDYTGYGLEYDDLILVPFGDWKSYLKDVANEFAQCLPDGFEDFVDVESLFNSDLSVKLVIFKDIYLYNSLTTSSLFVSSIDFIFSSIIFLSSFVGSNNFKPSLVLEYISFFIFKLPPFLFNFYSFTSYKK